MAILKVDDFIFEDTEGNKSIMINPDFIDEIIQKRIHALSVNAIRNEESQTVSSPSNKRKGSSQSLTEGGVK